MKLIKSPNLCHIQQGLCSYLSEQELVLVRAELLLQPLVPDLGYLVLVMHQHLCQRHPALGVLLQEVEPILLLRAGRQTQH